MKNYIRRFSLER